MKRNLRKGLAGILAAAILAGPSLAYKPEQTVIIYTPNQEQIASFYDRGSDKDLRAPAVNIPETKLDCKKYALDPQCQYEL